MGIELPASAYKQQGIERPKSGGSRHKILSRGLNRSRGEMNATEARYRDLLETDDSVFAIYHEPFSLRLTHPPKGQPGRVTPDFMVVMMDGTTYLDDVKGAGPDDAASIVRMKCAAELYPIWVFRIAKETGRKTGVFDWKEL